MPPRSWRVSGDDPDWRYVTICCANGHLATVAHLTHPELHRGHTIATDGEVSPSVVCPITGCDYHEFVRLVGWSG